MTYPEQNQSPIRAQISDSFILDGIAVRISLHTSWGDVKILKFREDGSVIFETYEVGTLADPGVTFALQNEYARALLDALLRYYQGASDMHTIRADLLHERGRVDNLIRVVSEIATTNAQYISPKN